MITILFKKQNNNFLAMEITGHSGYAPAGQDIVCSAVSSLAQTLNLGLSNVVGINTNLLVDENVPIFSLTLPKLNGKQQTDAQLLFKTTYLALKDIANQYKKYITIKEINK